MVGGISPRIINSTVLNMIIYKVVFTIAVVKYKSPYETLAVMLLVQKINFLCGR